MGVPTVTAARILKGQMNYKLGPETPLAMDHFPYLALSKVRAGGHKLLHSRGVRVRLGSVAGGKAPEGLGPELGYWGREDGPLRPGSGSG